MQHNSIIRTIYFYLFSLAIFLIPALCFADNPRVISATANPPLIGSGHMTVLSWTIDGSSSGSNLYFTCVQGVKITSSDGTIIPCNTRYPTIFNISGSIGLKLINISGNVVSLPVRVYPKDITGVDYDAGATDTYITLNAVSQLLTEFTATTTVMATTLKATTTATFTWLGPYLDKVNFQFTCAEGVKIFQAGDLLSVPCGVLALKNDLPGSGSAAFVFANSSFSKASVNASILPMISTGVYHAYQGKSLDLDITERMSPKSIWVDYFTAPKKKISSGDSLAFSWRAVNAQGVNFQMFVCNNAVEIKTSQSTTTEKLRCGAPAFDQIFPAASTTTLYFTNNSVNEQTVSVSLLPQNDDGTYNGTMSKEISIIVLPVDQSSVVSAVSALTAPSSASSTAITAQPAGTSTGIKAIHTITFTQYLSKASRLIQVKALQQFLAQDKTLYPEGLITGYYGDLTVQALRRFQCKYNIVCSGTPSSTGYGATGPKTRAKLNSLDRF